ncbi:MAG TPA: hypothetical protein P5105_06645 [Victivallales bacterium]|nr:hypothetical protein [Victivallales bacterium]
MNLKKKEKKLKTNLLKIKKLAIAFSGGFDSSFLAKFAEMILNKNNVILIHVESCFSPSRDKRAAAKFAKENQLRLFKINATPLTKKEITDNTKDRCYYCKTVIMKMIINCAKKNGFLNVADGSNYDDIFEERPGFKACKELKILHPLLDSYITKRDMIKLSKKYNFNLKYCPSSACLATRVPMGTKIKLK